MPYTHVPKNRRRPPQIIEPIRKRRSNADANISCLILTLIVFISVFLSANGYAYISAVRTVVSAYGA